MRYVRKIHIEVARIRAAADGSPSDPLSFPFLWEITASVGNIPLLLFPSIATPLLRSLKITSTRGANLEQWRTFLSERSDGDTIEELTLSAISEEDYGLLVPFISPLRSIARLELQGPNLEVFLHRLLEETSRPASEANSASTMFPKLTTIAIRDYRGDGILVRSLVEARLAVYTRLKDRDGDIDMSANDPLVAKLEKVEWYNCPNVRPALQWEVIHLCDASVETEERHFLRI